VREDVHLPERKIFFWEQRKEPLASERRGEIRKVEGLEVRNPYRSIHCEKNDLHKSRQEVCLYLEDTTILLKG